MPDMRFSDRATMSGTWQHKDGYLIAEAFAVRTGIQLYAGSEVGKPNMSVVRVYRPEDEVRHADSLRTFSHAPVTLGHPKEDVTAENWRDLARGEVSTEAEWKDGKIKLPLIVKDAQAISAINDGSARELSAGYACQLEFVDGVTPQGEKYDAVQRNIRINHLALVPAGRAGAECRVGDAAYWGPAPVNANDGGATMPVDIKPVVLGDRAVNVPVDIHADVQAFVDSTKATISAKDAAHSAAMAAKDAQIATLTAERDAAKAAQMTDAQLDQKVQERANLIDLAKRIVPDVDVTKSNDEIRSAVVVAKIGDSAKNQAAEYYKAAFDIFAKDAKPADQFANHLQQSRLPASGSGANVVDMKALGDAARAAHDKRNAAITGAYAGVKNETMG